MVHGSGNYGNPKLSSYSRIVNQWQAEKRTSPERGRRRSFFMMFFFYSVVSFQSAGSCPQRGVLLTSGQNSPCPGIPAAQKGLLTPPHVGVLLTPGQSSALAYQQHRRAAGSAPAGRTPLTWLCRWCGAGCGLCPCRAHAGTRRRASGRRGCRASSAARSLCRSCTGRKRGQL
ncbi:hypothetical protein SAMN04487833_11722 [Sarcina sp. DSM 11001]|nr:hypothetical protein SAMN04487833_11722 [Sarcina sp. DSM 11001]